MNLRNYYKIGRRFQKDVQEIDQEFDQFGGFQSSDESGNESSEARKHVHEEDNQIHDTIQVVLQNNPSLSEDYLSGSIIVQSNPKS